MPRRRARAPRHKGGQSFAQSSAQEEPKARAQVEMVKACHPIPALDNGLLSVCRRLDRGLLLSGPVEDVLDQISATKKEQGLQQNNKNSTSFC